MPVRSLALAAILALTVTPALSAPQPARPADSLADMLGINVHLGFGGTVYDTHFATIVKPRLLELGARHIRDAPGGATDTKIKSRFIELAQSGVRTLMILWPETGRDWTYAKGLNQTAGVVVVEAMEPPNERDKRWQYHDFGTDWPAKMRSWMEVEYPKIKADPVLGSLPVLGPSFANTRDSPARLATAFPSAVGFLDAGNLHDYSGLYPEHPTYSGGWGITIQSAIDRYKALSGGEPLWVTENGYKYSGAVEGHPVVTPRAAAKYLPRQLLVHLGLGVSRFYVYELLNEADENFAILNNDGTARPAFTSLKNHIALFADPGPTFVPGSLDYTLSTTSGVRQMLFQKRDGRFLLALWQPVASVTGGTRDGTAVDVEPARKSVTIRLSTRITTARTYNPAFSSRAIKTNTNAAGLARVGVSVPDHPLVVELIP